MNIIIIRHHKIYNYTGEYFIHVSPKLLLFIKILLMQHVDKLKKKHISHEWLKKTFREIGTLIAYYVFSEVSL